jgi:hypothetical protein
MERIGGQTNNVFTKESSSAQKEAELANKVSEL